MTTTCTGLQPTCSPSSKHFAGQRQSCLRAVRWQQPCSKPDHAAIALPLQMITKSGANRATKRRVQAIIDLLLVLSAQDACNKLKHVAAHAGQQLAHLLSSDHQHLFEASFEQQLHRLPPLQQAPQAADAAEISADLLDGLARRVAALRQSERQRAAEESLYLRCDTSSSVGEAHAICAQQYEAPR